MNLLVKSLALLSFCPLAYADTVLLRENFEDVPLGVALTSVPGWTGESAIKVSGSLLDKGQSIEWSSSTPSTYPSVKRSFANTPGIGDIYTVTATLQVPDTTGSYAMVSLQNSAKSDRAIQAILGNNVLIFNVLGTAAGKLDVSVPQLTVPIDIKLIVSAKSISFYYKEHSLQAWMLAGDVPHGNPMALYNEISITGDGAGGVDSVQVATNTPVQEGFEGGEANASVASLPGWSGDGDIVISEDSIGRRQYAQWKSHSSGAWPKVAKGFSNTPGKDDIYTMTATLFSPDTTGAYASIALGSSANPDQAVKVVMGYNELSFHVLGTAAGSFKLSNPQLTVPTDIKVVVSSSDASFYYKGSGDDVWISAGTIPHGNALGIYDEISIAGHGNHPGGVDSIQLALEGTEIPMSHGRKVMLDRGLQLQSLVFFSELFGGFTDIPQWLGANFTTINFWQALNPTLLGQLPPGTLWTRLYWEEDPSTMYLKPDEMAYAKDVPTLQFDDEMGNTLEPEMQATMFKVYREWNKLYPNTIVHTNFGGYPTWAKPNTLPEVSGHMQSVQPDMLMFDAYPPVTYPDVGKFPYMGRENWYTYMQIYRTAALRGWDGTGMQPIPYAQYLNLFHDSENPKGLLPSESYVRMQQFVSWTFGYTCTAAFIYNSYSKELRTSLFADMSDKEPTPVFDYVAKSNAWSKNLGPALTRMQNTDVRFISAKVGGVAKPMPPGMVNWGAGAGGCPYIKAVAPRGTSNVSDPSDHCDWVIGYFMPLRADNSDYPFASGQHFMITNAATGTPSLPGAPGDPASASAQWVRIEFDFTGTPYNALQRLNRTNGELETVNLVAADDGRYHLDLQLDGGTGDLFRFLTVK